MVLLYQNENKETDITFYYLISRKSNTEYPKEVSSKQSQQLLWSYNGGVLQLEFHNNDDKNDKFKINNGNVEPFRGFGHIAFNTNDVYSVSEELEKKGVLFKKKPDEGRMKGLAFVYDPNGYWIEIVSRKGFTKDEKYNLSQTMIRIKSPEKSLKFYCDFLGMRLVSEMHFEKGKFSLFFLSSFVDNSIDIDNLNDEERKEIVKKQWGPVLELTHNHGTEKDDKFNYHDGRTTCDLGIGFAHLTLLANKISGGTHMYDPDGYKVQLQEKG
eukprot:969719_1